MIDLSIWCYCSIFNTWVGLLRFLCRSFNFPLEYDNTCKDITWLVVLKYITFPGMGNIHIMREWLKKGGGEGDVVKAILFKSTPLLII